MNTPVASQATAEGLFQSMEVRQGGWHRAHVLEDGREYPLRLDTKLDNLVAAMGSLVGQRVQVVYTERQGNPNPNKPGTFYINRTLQNIQPVSVQEVWQGAQVQTGTVGVSDGVSASAEPLERQGSASFVRRVTWLSAASTIATLMQNLVGPDTPPERVKEIGPALYALTDSLYARAMMVSAGRQEQSSNPGVSSPTSSVEEPDDEIPF